MCLIGEDRGEAFLHAGPVGSQSVLQPVKRLNDAHGGSACPVEFAWRRQPEDDPEVTKFERLQAGIGMDHDACRHRIGEAQVLTQ